MRIPNPTWLYQRMQMQLTEQGLGHMAILPVLHHCIFSLSSSVGWCALFICMYVLLCFATAFCFSGALNGATKHTQNCISMPVAAGCIFRHAGVYVMRCIYFSIALCALFVWKCYCWFVRCLCATSIL